MPQIILEDIPIELTHKKMKNIRLRVCQPDGEVKVSAPYGTKLALIESFLYSKLDWIRQHQKNLERREKKPEQKFNTGELHYFKGKPYPLEVTINKSKSCVIFSKEKLILNVRDKSSSEKKEQALNEWYRHQLKTEIKRLIKKYEPIMEVSVAEFGVKNMKTNWGSCNYSARRIWLNLQLAKKPSECLEYVVVHEMVHLLEPSHNKRFYTFMDSFLPQWTQYKEELDKPCNQYCQ